MGQGTRFKLGKKSSTEVEHHRLRKMGGGDKQVPQPITLRSADTAGRAGESQDHVGENRVRRKEQRETKEKSQRESEFLRNRKGKGRGSHPKEEYYYKKRTRHRKLCVGEKNGEIMVEKDRSVLLKGKRKIYAVSLS